MAYVTVNAYGSAGPVKQPIETIKQHDFSPYSDNGGSTVAIAGDDYVIIGSDTRLSSGYSIHTRDQPKLFSLTSSSVLGSTGCWCDVLTFTKILEARLKTYLNEHLQEMSTTATAQVVSNMLYNKRFFPYYISNMLVGLDEEGKGVVYSYDPVGHTERKLYGSAGSASPLMQPLLDNQVGQKNMLQVGADGTVLGETKPASLPLEKALCLVKDCFISATERDIRTGDSLLIKIVTREGVKEETMPLRKD